MPGINSEVPHLNPGSPGLPLVTILSSAVSAKTTPHARETAHQTDCIGGWGASSSNTTVNLLIFNFRVLNANTKAAGLSGKRQWSSWVRYNSVLGLN